MCCLFVKYINVDNITFQIQLAFHQGISDTFLVLNYLNFFLQLFQHIEQLFPALVKTLSDPSDEVRLNIPFHYRKVKNSIHVHG